MLLLLLYHSCSSWLVITKASNSTQNDSHLEFSSEDMDPYSAAQKDTKH